MVSQYQASVEIIFAPVAELAYACASGAHGITPVWVQVPPRAPTVKPAKRWFFLSYTKKKGPIPIRARMRIKK